MVRKKIEDRIKEYFKDKGIDPESVLLEHPEDLANGDYSTSAALVYVKELGKNSRDLAEEIKKYLEENKLDEISKIETAGPGFINFFLSKEFFKKSLKEIIKKGEKFGESETLKGEKIIVEYT